MTEYYNGNQFFECGRTAIHNDSPAPAVRWLVEKRHIVKGMTVYDFGAGYGRNAKFLRDEGCNVYAYDPYNGFNPYDSKQFGWRGVSNIPLDLDDLIDDGSELVFLSCFVLNVVPYRVEKDIIDMGWDFDTRIHITRNSDMVYSVRKALMRKDRGVTEWYEKFAGRPPMLLNWKDVQDFCNYGVRTSRGFQRDVHLWEPYRYDLEHQTYGYKIFIK